MPDFTALTEVRPNPAAGQPLSPLWWLYELNRRMEARRAYIEEREAYYDGEHPLMFATAKFKEAFGDLFAAFADNWCQVIVDSAAERLAIDGFRFGTGEGDDAGDEAGDSDAWELWQRNGLDAMSSIAHVEAIKLSEASVIIEPVPGKDPRITIEHPNQVMVARDRGDHRTRHAALKKWQDDVGYVYCTVYMPDGVYRFRSANPLLQMGEFATADFIERPDVQHFVPNGPLKGFVPVVPLYNNPSLLRGGRSDLDVVIPLQNGLNKLMTDMFVASEFSAFRQRLLTGMEIPRYPEGHPQEGQPMSEAFIAGVSRLMVVEDPEAKAQEFGATDLGNYVKAVDLLVQHVAAQTKTPPHYLVGTVVNASGDALKAAEAGLVSKARGKARQFGEAWEDVMRLAFRAKGDTKRADAVKAEVVWRNPENRTDSDIADAAVKRRAAGVPEEFVWEFMGYTPQQIARMRVLRDQEIAQLQAVALAGTLPGDQGLANSPAASHTPPPAAGTNIGKAPSAPQG